MSNILDKIAAKAACTCTSSSASSHTLPYPTDGDTPPATHSCHASHTWPPGYTECRGPQMPIRTFAAAAHFGLRMRLPVQIRPVRPDYPPFERRIRIQAANRPPLSAADIACRLHLLLFRCFLTQRILTTANKLF